MRAKLSMDSAKIGQLQSLLTMYLISLEASYLPDLSIIRLAVWLFTEYRQSF